MSTAPRLAGTPSETNSAKYIYKKWKEEGLDNVELTDYDVLLAYPDEKIKNKYFLITKPFSQSIFLLTLL